MKQRPPLPPECLCPPYEVSVIFILDSPRGISGSVFGHSMYEVNLIRDLLTQELQTLLCIGISEQLPSLAPAGKEPKNSDDVVHLV